jgi:hypothetical protein
MKKLGSSKKGRAQRKRKMKATNQKHKKAPVGHVAVAVHAATKDGVHVVGVGNIRVVIVPDDGSYFAQGLDLDYAAQGSDLQSTKKNFEDGLSATIEKHLQMFGDIRRLLRVAPPDICQRVLLNSSAQFKRYSQISAHEVHEAINEYANIEYLVAAAVTSSGA